MIVDPARSRLWVWMYCPGRCVPEEVWMLNSDLKVLRRVQIETRCSDSLVAPGMALDPRTGSLIIGSCEADEAFIVDEKGIKRRLSVPQSGAFAVVEDVLIALSDPMMVVDLLTGRDRARVAAGGIAIEAIRYKDSLYLLQTVEEESAVTEVGIGTWTVRRTIQLPTTRECMALDSDSLLLTAGGGEDVVSVALRGRPTVRTVSVPALDCTLMVDASRRVGYMPFETESEWGVLAVDLGDFRRQASLSIGDSTIQWAVFDGRGALFAEVGGELVKVRVE